MDQREAIIIAQQYVDLVNILDEMKITGIDVFPIEAIGNKEIAFLQQKNVY